MSTTECRESADETLTDLANRYNSDKGDQVGCRHRYALLYESLFEPFRQQPISFLEIGLQRENFQKQPDCPSLRMWLEYFPLATIHGFDISDFSDVTLPRAKIFRGDQSDAERLKEVAEEAGPFDIIIDDGSHASAHQQITLGALFPYLKHGGLYIIEDSHWQPWRDEERKGGIRTMLEIFKPFALDGKPLQSRYLSTQQCDDIAKDIVRCTFSHPSVMASECAPNQPSGVRELIFRMRKGKTRKTDHRLFKLIVLEKRLIDDEPSCGTVTVRLTPDVV